MKTSTETYVHRFKNGVVAKATVRVEPPSFAVEWSVKPTKAVLAEYFAWRDGMMSDLAKKTGGRVLVVNL